ncbi:hypothetical protein ACSSS7_007843 [Eimeria intestinalis]
MVTTRRTALRRAATRAARTRRLIDATPAASPKRSRPPPTPSITRDGGPPVAPGPASRPPYGPCGPGRPLALSLPHRLPSPLSSLDSTRSFERLPLSLAPPPTRPQTSAEVGPAPVAPRDPGPLPHLDTAPRN